ncbi:MAG: LLM class flavin-dependent oxidoreductase [Acidimicrobiales bacterium]|nr:LLM class flavin-dependent oxidoreductase [Acidimicrobiales bacterium]
MRFAVFDQVELDRDVSLSRQYRDRMEYIRALDEAGFWCYFKSEHHGIGLDAAPDSGTFLAAASQHTERMRLGSLVYLLPFHHPLRLAEHIAMLDNLCDGRLEVGIGKGISSPEHELWGLDPDQGGARRDEAFDVLVKALTSDTVDHHGVHDRFDGMPVTVRPVQRPHPPFWYPGNVRAAAQRGMNTVTGGPPSHVASQVELYRSLCDQASTGRGQVAGTYTFLVCETDDEALSRVRSAWARFTENLTPLFRRWGLAVPNDPTCGGDVDVALQRNSVIAGSPATVARFVERFEAESNADLMLCKFTWGDLSHAEAMRSMSLFVEATLA